MSKNVSVSTDILFFAFRYALGRRTYAVKIVSDCIIKHWSKFSAFDQIKIKNEIEREIELDNAGAPVDVATWKVILEL